eukprot:1295555-Lingulodinium_polyedra.AAC.1
MLTRQQRREAEAAAVAAAVAGAVQPCDERKGPLLEQAFRESGHVFSNLVGFLQSNGVQLPSEFMDQLDRRALANAAVEL